MDEIISINGVDYAPVKAKSETQQPAVGLLDAVGKKRLVRTYSAGVWFGTVIEKSGQEVILKDARRLWSWQAVKGISLSGVALFGVTKESRIEAPVTQVWMEAIELIECSESAISSIEGAGHAEAE